MSISSPPNMPGFTVITAPVRNKHSQVIIPVTVSALAKSTRLRPILRVNFNMSGFGDDVPPAWLKAGGKVWALRGHGEFAGTLRIMPNGPLPLGKPRRGNGCRLDIPALPGHPDEGGAKTEVQFDFSDGWFDITLPDWHGPRPAVPQPAVSAAAALTPTAPAKPFSLAAGTTSHPNWASDAGRTAHARAVKGGAA